MLKLLFQGIVIGGGAAAFDRARFTYFSRPGQQWPTRVMLRMSSVRYFGIRCS